MKHLPVISARFCISLGDININANSGINEKVA